MLKNFLEKSLISSAKKLLARQKPEIVAVTGSVGKTSAKQAIATVLSKKFAVGASNKNYNTEIGLACTVLGLEPAGSSALGWLSNLWTAWRRAAVGIKDYPKVMVLEMGADRPGDIAKLVAIAKPDVAVVTAVGESHAEFFGSVDDIVREKRTVVEALGPDDVVVLSRDDEKVWPMRNTTKARAIGFGFHEEATVRALADTVSYACAIFDVDPSADRELRTGCGMHFKMNIGGGTFPVFLPNVLGRAAIMAALAGAAVGHAKGMNGLEIADALRSYVAPAGRMRLIPGIKRTYLIDDSYNSAPRSSFAAIDALVELPKVAEAKTFAVLADMMELGKLSQKGHEDVGRKVAESGVSVFVAVGERMHDAVQAALSAGMPQESIFHFGDGEEAGRFVQERFKEGDVVLIKGSQSMRMERVVKELMADPLLASKLLVRQEEYWLNKA